MSRATNHEFRVIRPFEDPHKLESVLDDAVLHFGDKQCEAGSRIVLDRDQFAGREASITWSSDHRQFCTALEQGLGGLDLAPTDTEIVVQVRTGYLGLVSEALRLPLDDLGRLRSSSPIKPDAISSSPSRGARVRVFLVLRSSTEQRPLRPWRKGTWLARVEFVVATDWLGQLYSLKPLNQETREQNGLPANAMRWVNLDSHEPLESFHAEGYEPPEFYLDQDLLGLISGSGTPAAHALHLQLVQDFVTAVVQKASSQMAGNAESVAWEDAQDSLLGRILIQTAGKRGDPEALLEEVRSDPCKVLAKFEHHSGLMAKYRAAVTGGDE